MLAPERNASSPQRLRYPYNLQELETNPSWIQFSFFDRKDETDSFPSDVVSLYMPEQVSQPSTVSWDSEGFGFVGNIVREAGRAFNGADGILTGAMAAGLSAWENKEGTLDLVSARAIANVGAAAVALMGGNASAEGLMGDVAGKIPNPYLTMIFRGINFRDFSFVFKFYPHAEEDCDTIDAIIRTFRANALPEYQSGDAFFGYPKECRIEYMWQDQRNPYLHRFKRSVCTAVDVDYTASGMFTTMRNGFPSEVTLSTKWTEIELVTRKDIWTDGEEGGY